MSVSDEKKSVSGAQNVSRRSLERLRISSQKGKKNVLSKENMHVFLTN